MADIETRVGEAAIERAIATFEKMKTLSYKDQVQARKAVTDFVFAQIAGGELDEHCLVIAALTHLKSLERNYGFTR